jgi:hypothetical protein
MADVISCEGCGDENPADARFCIGCGAALMRAATGPTIRLGAMECPDCYTINPADSFYCGNCGRCLNDEPSAYARPGQPTPVPQPVRDEILDDDAPIGLKVLLVVFELIS